MKNNNIIQALWCEKYRPSNLSDYVFHDNTQRKAFERFVAEKSIPHLLLSGVAGSGKTTIAQILINEIGLEEMDVKVINASDENSVDVMRDQIKNFVSTYAMSNFKIVHLEECDYISPNGQGLLRRLMEEFSDQARFILTCNYENKVIPAIRSRCQHFRFKSPDQNAVTEYICKILLDENITFDLPLLDRYVSAGYPDIRKIVNLVQQNSDGGVLESMSDSGGDADYKFKLIELIEADKWNAARLLICSSVAQDEWEDVYRFLYENIHKSKAFSSEEKWEPAIILIANHLYKDALVADHEINLTACIIQLGMLAR